MSIFGVQNVVVGKKNILKKQLHDYAIHDGNLDRANFQVEKMLDISKFVCFSTEREREREIACVCVCG